MSHHTQPLSYGYELEIRVHWPKNLDKSIHGFDEWCKNKHVVSNCKQFAVQVNTAESKCKQKDQIYINYWSFPLVILFCIN